MIPLNCRKQQASVHFIFMCGRLVRNSPVSSIDEIFCFSPASVELT